MREKMKRTELAAAAIFLTGFLGAGFAHAQHNHGGAGMPQGQPQNTAEMCPLRVKIFEPALKNTENGVEIMLTGKDLKTIAILRELAARHFSSKEEMDRNCPGRIAGAKTTVEEVPGGVRITITALSPAAIKGIQATAAFYCKREQPGAKRIFTTYVCPMRDYQSSKPGKCPQCGMDLVEKQ